MISRQIGRVFGVPRDGLARALLRLGLRPNHITVVGTLLTIGAGMAIAAGRSSWHTWALGFLVAAGACDLLDGAMAKLGRIESRFGAVLDSTCDRAGDAALYLGPALYFARFPDDVGGRPNLTLLALAGAGLTWAYLISYIRARAENVGVPADGGFWQRPERFVTILLGVPFHHLTTAVWILGLLPLTTVAHRLWRTRRVCALAAAGDLPTAGAERVDPKGLAAIILWRWPRDTFPFDIYAGTIIAMLLFCDIPAIDPLRDLVAWWQP